MDFLEMAVRNNINLGAVIQAFYYLYSGLLPGEKMTVSIYPVPHEQCVIITGMVRNGDKYGPTKGVSITKNTFKPIENREVSAL